MKVGLYFTVIAFFGHLSGILTVGKSIFPYGGAWMEKYLIRTATM